MTNSDKSNFGNLLKQAEDDTFSKALEYAIQAEYNLSMARACSEKAIELQKLRAALDQNSDEIKGEHKTKTRKIKGEDKAKTGKRRKKNGYQMFIQERYKAVTEKCEKDVSVFNVLAKEWKDTNEDDKMVCVQFQYKRYHVMDVYLFLEFLQTYRL